MKSIRKRNLVYRVIFISIVLVLFAFLLALLPSGPQETSAHEKEINHPEEIVKYEPVVSKTQYEIKEGDTLLGILQTQVGIEYEKALILIEQIDEVFDITKIRMGNTVDLTYEDDELIKVSYDINSNEELVMTPSADDFVVERKDIEFTIEEGFSSGEVETSLYQSALDAGMTDRMIMELATVFAWDVDFTSSIQKGDKFSLVYENKYREGEFAGTGDLIAARFVNNGEEFFTYLVKDEDGKNQYYNEDGDATERLLLKTPLSYKRISSGFSLNRKHPILGTFKTHRAIDFAADTGTPVETVGNGTVTFAGWSDTYGNYIKIDHGGGFVTAYAHLSKMYVSKGARVKQGDLIGAVGSTGRSTGPHLHYEMYKNGTPVNPLTTETPSGKPISEEMKPVLQQVVSEYKSKLI